MRMQEGQAVLRQPHHLRRQHHDARQRDPPRAAALRKQPVRYEALKNSIRRINQLGYFKALEGPGKDVLVDKTPGADNKLDVTLKVEEQNRNQLTFGAGVSQFEGFFGQLSFQTANFLGRGESLTVSLQGGSRASELHGRLHGAVPVRPQHHRRRRTCSSRNTATSASSRRGPRAAR